MQSNRNQLWNMLQFDGGTFLNGFWLWAKTSELVSWWGCVSELCAPMCPEPSTQRPRQRAQLFIFLNSYFRPSTLGCMHDIGIRIAEGASKSAARARWGQHMSRQNSQHAYMLTRRILGSQTVGIQIWFNATRVQP